MLSNSVPGLAASRFGDGCNLIRRGARNGTSATVREAALPSDSTSRPWISGQKFQASTITANGATVACDKLIKCFVGRTGITVPGQNMPCLSGASSTTNSRPRSVPGVERR